MKNARSMRKVTMYGILGAFLVNGIALIYLWFVNNTGNNIALSMLWCAVNAIWLIAEIICTKKLEHPIYKNWRVWVSCLFLLIALFTLAIYMFTASMPYAAAAMRWAIAEGLITGVTDTTLEPQGSATRAQAATILMRFCEEIAK